MTTITIDLSGLKPAARAPESRRFVCPDGIDRIITLSRFTWERYDFLCTIPWIEFNYFVEGAFQTALDRIDRGEAGDFEDDFRDGFRIGIRVAWEVHTGKYKLGANRYPNRPEDG